MTLICCRWQKTRYKFYLWLVFLRMVNRQTAVRLFSAVQTPNRGFLSHQCLRDGNKKCPQRDICISGGVGMFYGPAHTKCRDYQGIFVISAPAHHQSFSHKLYCVVKFRYFTQNTAIYIIGNYFRKTGMLYRTIRQYYNKK